MARRILDQKLMAKVAKKLGIKKITNLNVRVSQRAQRDGISSQAALVRIARELKIGTSSFMNKLDPTKRAEVREAPVAQLVGAVAKVRRTGAGRTSRSERTGLKEAVQYLIHDPELQERCIDILLARRHFDRPINQATLILEERIRTKSAPPTRLVGEQLVNYAFKEELARTVLQVPGGEADDQRGFTQMLRGIVPTFRNKTHHHITKTFSREDAMSVCGFIDVLLRVIDGSTKVR
jgi:uncharacterized protein (TIGR02391 family)